MFRNVPEHFIGSANLIHIVSPTEQTVQASRRDIPPTATQAIQSLPDNASRVSESLLKNTLG